MLKEKAFWWSIIGFFTVCVLGTINHYLYQICGHNNFVACFAPVNESVWEHLKILYFPFMLFCIIEFFVYGKNIKGFLFSRFTGLLCGLLFIPLSFYAYSSIVGEDVMVLDILIFIIAVAISYYVSFKRIKNNSDSAENLSVAAIILFLGLTILFAGLTFYPPQTALFQSPV